MADLVLKGHAIRGKEVIDLLEMLGAHRLGYNDTFADFYYYIECEAICSSDVCPIYSTVFTLEKFLEKYPYKVGDKVILDEIPCTITWMCWECNNIYYQVQGIGDAFTKINKKVTAEKLKPYKEETMKESEELIVGFTEDNGRNWVLNIHKDYEIKEIDVKFKVVKKQPKYPTTYEECCKIVNASPYIKLNYNTPKGQKYSYDVDNLQLYENLRRLKICRDAYWKIAGDWQPDWEDENQEKRHIISSWRGTIECLEDNFVSYFLAFPTAEMRNAFYENFKELIEQCKELL